MAGTRHQPSLLGEAEAMPKSGGEGYWHKQMRDLFEKNPGTIYRFGGVSSTTASNLRADFGLDAVTTTVDGERVLVVRWVPERAEEIKAEVKARGEKRKATIAANKAKKEAETTEASGRRGR